MTTASYLSPAARQALERQYSQSMQRREYAKAREAAKGLMDSEPLIAPMGLWQRMYDEADRLARQSVPSAWSPVWVALGDLWTRMCGRVFGRRAEV